MNITIRSFISEATFILFVGTFILAGLPVQAQLSNPQSSPVEQILTSELPQVDTLRTGREMYEETCARCHGTGGTGQAAQKLGLDVQPPDFTNCSFVTREPDQDFLAVAHVGGPVRGFSPPMPPHGSIYSSAQIQRIVNYIRTFCTDDDWPRGELNLPRPMVTEKAYPEDEAVISSSVDAEGSGAVMNEFVFEKRFGARNQLEVVIPFGLRERPSAGWSPMHVGDVALGVKRALYHSLQSGTILSLTGEVILPTGDSDAGFGKGTTVLEPFVSFGQILPVGAFIHAQSGVEFPTDRDLATEEAFWRAVLGKSMTQGRWGRTWSPMVEVLGSREFEGGAQTHWDLVPQVQVTLNKRQHIMANVGVRIPVDDPGRSSQVMVYLLWDWFDGGFFEGW